MPKPLLLLSLAVLLNLTVSAQKNFVPATVVSLAGDTIKGQIDYKNWSKNPSTINFRENDNAVVISYGPSMIRAFMVANEIYQRAVVEIDDRYDDLKHLSSDNHIITRIDTVFLNVIVGGNRPLYHYYDNVHHFYISSGSDFELLKYKKYVTSVINGAFGGEDKAIGVIKDYLIQLQEYLKDCASNKKFLADAKYDAFSLRKAFLRYYDCVGTGVTEQVYIHKEDKERLEIGLIAGMSNTSLDVTTTEADIIARVNFPSSTNFTGGVFVDIVLPRQRSRLSINNELLYTSYKTSGQSRTSISDTRYDEYRFIFNYGYLKMNNMARYKFLFKDASIFVNAGVSNGIALKAEYSSRLFHKFDDSEIDREQPRDHTKKHEIGFFIGAGARKGRGSLEVRAERSDGMFYLNEINSKILRYFLLFGYRLK